MNQPNMPRDPEGTENPEQNPTERVSSGQTDDLQTEHCTPMGPIDPELSKLFADEFISRQFNKFNSTFEEIVSKESSSARSLFPFIRGKLFQYALWRQYDEVAILQEVYIRTIEKILEGRKITNHYAWIRSVAFRIIRELSRKKSRTVNVDTPLIELLAPVEGIDESFLTAEMLKLRRAFEELSSEERLLLSLKTVQDLSWAEIQTIWIDSGYGYLSIPALRKRKERSLSHLRTIYHTL